jgi:signal transduction histidine kinase
MSHELRTPLNSLLILSKLLSQNATATSPSKQVEFAQTIHSSGSDLLELINEILDLSRDRVGHDGRRREAGAASPSCRAMSSGRSGKSRSARGSTSRRAGAGLPVGDRTDPKRLQQVLKNLLSNALKFTERGSVRLTSRVRRTGGARDHRTLNPRRGRSHSG